MTATIDPIVSPDPATMRDFLEHLFGGYLDGYHSGLVELAYKDGERWGAVTFGTDQLDELVEEACRLNSVPGINVYVGAWLRRETAANRRASDPDAWAMTCAYVDLDHEGTAAAAKQVYGQLKPSWITVTGSFPHTRAQMWWRLAEPITDHHRGRELLTVMGRAMKGDPTIVNPSRVMRLAGSVAWPTKDGRRVEPTRRGTLKEAGAKVYAAESLERTFTQYQPPTGGSPNEQTLGPKPDQTQGPTAGSLGLPLLLTDGREDYMTRTVCALLIEYIGQNGAAPNAEELCEYVWPQYSQGVDFSRAGRGKDELLRKCISTLRRFHDERIAGLPDLDAAIARYEAKQPKAIALPTTIIVPYKRRDPRTIKPREWIYGTQYIRGFISTTVAPGGVGKSSLTIAETLAMCSGKPILGVPVHERVNVMLWNGEDPMDELERRIEATAKHHGITDEDLAGRLFVASGHNCRLTVAIKTRDGVQITAGIEDLLVTELRENNIGVFIVDPFVSSHQVTENDNSEIEQVAALWGKIAQAANCSIHLVHHVRKTQPGMSVQVEDGRGAGALLAKARVARAINRMTQEECKAAGLKPDVRGLYFRTDDGKANLAPPSEGANWYHLVSVDLGNGTGFRPSDKVGVVEAWEWPDLMADVTGTLCDAVLAAMGTREFRQKGSGPDWLGHVIMELGQMEPEDEQSVATARRCIDAWIKSKVLEVVKRSADGHKNTPFVKVRGT